MLLRESQAWLPACCQNAASELPEILGLSGQRFWNDLVRHGIPINWELR